MYHSQVKNYIDQFGFSNVCVMFYEDLKTDGVLFSKNIFSFLNLNHDTSINFNLKYNSLREDKPTYLKF